MSVNTKKTKTRGRPLGRAYDRPMQMRVTEEFITLIDNWRREQIDLPNRTQAIRRLVVLGIEASKGKKR